MPPAGRIVPSHWPLRHVPDHCRFSQVRCGRLWHWSQLPEAPPLPPGASFHSSIEMPARLDFAVSSRDRRSARRKVRACRVEAAPALGGICKRGIGRIRAADFRQHRCGIAFRGCVLDLRLQFGVFVIQPCNRIICIAAKACLAGDIFGNRACWVVTRSRASARRASSRSSSSRPMDRRWNSAARVTSMSRRAKLQPLLRVDRHILPRPRCGQRRSDGQISAFHLTWQARFRHHSSGPSKLCFSLANAVGN